MDITTTFLNKIENTLTQIIQYDPNSQMRLKQLIGQQCYFHIEPQPWLLQCLFQGNTIQLRLTQTADPKWPICQGPLKSFITLLLSKDHTLAAQEGLSLQGDTQLLNDIKRFFFELSIDWEEISANMCGDFISYQGARFVNATQDWFSYSRTALAQMIEEYVLEEKQWIANTQLVQQFTNDVDIIRHDTERLEKRLQQLRKNINILETV